MLIASLTIGWLVGLVASLSAAFTFGTGIFLSLVVFMIVGTVATLGVAALLAMRAEEEAAETAVQADAYPIRRAA